MSDAQEKRLNVRAESTLIDAFIACCESQDTTASQAVRAFMRDYVKKYGQKELFTGGSK